MCEMFFCVTLFAGLICQVLPARQTEPATLFVAIDGDDQGPGSSERPFRTIERAQTVVREKLKGGWKGQIEVRIGPGTYFLSQALRFESFDTAPGVTVTYVGSMDGASVVSGGLMLEGWLWQDGFWTGHLPDSKTGEQTPRQIFHAGRRLTRAREPDGDFYRVVESGPDHRTQFFYDPEKVVVPEKIAEVELVFLHDWSISRVGLKEINAQQKKIALARPVGADHDFFRIDGFEPHARYYLENAREFADEAGEWYFDRSTGQYSIRDVDGNNGPSSIVVPCLSTLLVASGSAGKPVRGLKFSQLEFRHTACALQASGGAEVQAGYYQARAANGSEPDEQSNVRFPAAVELESAEECVFENCRFENLGGGGLYIGEQSHRNRISGCAFTDIASCGVMIGDRDSRADGAGTSLACQGNQLTGCNISHCGQILFGSVGVWVGMTDGTQIEKNEIHDLPYTGVSLGWRWDPEPTVCRKNQVVDNHIHHVMQLLSDGGGIYTLGRQPETVLRGNRIHDIPINAGRAESNGIFMDEGSSLIEVLENEIFATAKSPIRFHKAKELKVHHNRLHFAANGTPFTYNATDPATIITEPNELIRDSSQ